MDGAIEETIPAFSMWKMFNETVIPALLNMEYSESSLQKLASIVKNREFLNIFVYSHDYSLSYESHHNIIKKYKTFTVWLLGRFFYLSYCDKFAKIHDLIMDAQWRILHKLCITETYVYEELSAEYASILEQLNEYHKSGQMKVVLQALVPYKDEELKNKLDLSALPIEVPSQAVCTNMQQSLIKMAHHILQQNIEFYFFNEVTYKILDCFIYILAECDTSLKLAVLHIYSDLLKNYQFYCSKFPYKFVEKFNIFVDYLEPLIYNTYNNKMEMSATELARFESILTTFFNFRTNLDRISSERIQNMAVFLIFKEIGESLHHVCCEQICLIQKAPFQNKNLLDNCLELFIKTDSVNLLKIVEKQVVLEVRAYICSCLSIESLKSSDCNGSTTWNNLWGKVGTVLEHGACKTSCCRFLNNLLIIGRTIEMAVRISIETQNYMVLERNTCNFIFSCFNKEQILATLLKVINDHAEACQQLIATNDVNDLLQKIFSLLPIACGVGHIEPIFACIGFGFIRKTELIYKSSLFSAHKELNLMVKNLCLYLAKQNFSKETSIKHLSNLLNSISAGVVKVQDPPDGIKRLQEMYLKIMKDVIDDGNSSESEVLKSLLTFPTIFDNVEYWIKQILLRIMEIHLNDPLLSTVFHPTSTIICKFHSRHIPLISWNSQDQNIQIETFCLSCMKNELGDSLSSQDAIKLLLQKYGRSVACKSTAAAYDVYHHSNRHLYHAFDALVKYIITLFKYNDARFRSQIVQTLMSLAHVSSFHTIDTTKLWLQFAVDDVKEVRRKFADVILPIFERIQNCATLSDNYKEEVLEVCFAELKCFTKKSLQHSDYDLQDTLLETLKQITLLHNEKVTINVVQLLLFFIMIPTSKYALVASNIFISMANNGGTTTNIIYSQYKRELSQTIVELCAINNALLDYKLNTSLEKISLILGYFGPKDFVTQECRYLLPVLVSLIIKMPQVEKLIEEVAAFLDMSISEVLVSKYGNIFLYLFLNKFEDGFKEIMNYVEKNAGINGNTLRKRNFQVILNELLLNFHDNQDRVLLAIRSLAREDSDSPTPTTQQIPEYLQPRFLGVLAYFDMKLITRHSSKKKVLLSLAQLFRFMGPKHITSLRFKILAMLRTALSMNYEVFPELNCDVWDAFVHNCDIDALGPQLASIFVSLLPLMRNFRQKIDAIFRYLIIENEKYVKEYIPDLFFVVEADVDYEMCLAIKKCLEPIESLPFKEQLKRFLKYLTHETIEIRVHGLKFLKRLLAKNREELDRMVLGYNGIDSTIVELLDILMLGCREKEEALKLACGECIGELGAIEPSHLPRQYTQETKSFMFFITEDTFIINALNELTRALQAEKNTQNMDRIALAIQEILKVHGISPDANSPKHHLWKTFPEAQRELMLPLLSSRYTMVQTIENVPASPIYASKFGTTFQSWMYNWICNLILAVNQDKRSLLQVCLPSLKQDHKTLMTFLPHVLLHALLENSDIHQKAYDEFMAVINSFSNRQQWQKCAPHMKSISFSSWSSSFQPVVVEESDENQYTKVIFVLLDFLNRWVREWVWENCPSGFDDEQYKTVVKFLSRFCKLQLARCNYQCGEYPRALMYLEEYLKDQSAALSNHFAFLSELYAELDEPDGVAGVTALQDIEPPLEQRLLALKVSGKLADATACYERIHPPLKLHHIQGLAQCYLDLDNVNTALNFVEGAINRQPEYTHMLLEIEAEPLWRLSRYDELDTLLKKSELKSNTSWGVQMGRALLHLRDGKRNEFKSVIDSLRLAQVESLGAASLKEGAYQHGYNYIAKLHALNELEQVESMIYELFARPNDHNVCESVVKQITQEWELRLKIVQESLRIQEPILCLRRVAIQQAKELLQNKVPSSVPLLDSVLGESWLLSATIARAAGIHQQAYTYALKAEEYTPPRLFLEKARLHWLREEHEQALTTLRRGLEVLVPDNTNTPNSPYGQMTITDRKIAAEAKLLIASYNDSISNVDIDVNIQHYKESIEVYKEWEKSLVCVAQYYDRIFQTIPDADKDSVGSDIQLHIINYFAKSLLYGTKFVYQSMPRLLSIWFDYGTRLLDVSEAKLREERQNVLLKMTKLIDTFLERLPAFIFLTAFSQLVSRICHPQKQVYIELKSIIIKLISHYPQQSLWMLISVIKSSYTVRSRRCAEILNDSRLKTASMIKLIGDFTKLAEKLIELCNKEIPDHVQVTSVNSLLRTLPRLLAKEDFSEIMIPTQKFRKLILPNPDFQSSQHNPFPNHYVHIVGIEDEVTVLQSLQHPRKITFRGSDGKLYVQMLKPKDDLRKDFRLMEFNDIVNQLLSRQADARQRRLNIRLYSVVPLNEECGLIEWVPNLIGLRPVLMKLYKQMGIAIRARELKQYCCNQRDPLTKKREMFTKCLLPKHPPVLGDWFKKAFPDAQGWFTARTAYIRTTAVISMVGYILGLGDRHGENILFDSTCGDTVHVDFNCLFNKGETFEWPERVPFRLTHNMVSAMGPLGVEGVFRKSCVCTLRVLRTHSTTLMSIVTPFVYDPLLSLPRNALAAANAQTSELTNERAVEHIRNIELRLQGIIKTKGKSCSIPLLADDRNKSRSRSIPLSVEGQTDVLIQEAMSTDNLCQMYFGWGPYL